MPIIKQNSQPKIAMNPAKNMIATFFGAGMSPVAPGTMGTLAAAAIYILFVYFYSAYYFMDQYGDFILLVCFGLACWGNIWSGGWAEQYYQIKDPHCVVIDEVAGYFLTVLFWYPSWQTALLAFIFFRLFDITKPPPIHKLEKLPEGWGILMDDLMASVYAILAMYILYWIVYGIFGIYGIMPYFRIPFLRLF